MAYNAYLYAKSEKGVIKGFTNQEDKTADGKSVKELCKCVGMTHQIHVPINEATHTSDTVGNPMHFPLQVYLEPDCALPTFMRAFHFAERLEEVKLYFFRAGTGLRKSGKPDEKYHNWFTITLKDARLVTVDTQKAPGKSGNSSGALDEVVLGFTYRQIQWEDHDDKKSAEDNWGKRQA
jgi:type VI secretion system Hcp family effector